MLRSDARALRNLVRTKEGQKVLTGYGITSVCVLALVLWLVNSTFLSDKVLDALRKDSTGQGLTMVLGGVLTLGVIAGLSLGMGPLGKGLFKSHMAAALLASPVSTARLVTRAWVQVVVLAGTAGMLVAAPAVIGLAAEGVLSPLAVATLPVAILVVIGPMFAVTLAIRVLAAWWLANPTVRAVVQIASLVLTLAAFAAILLGLGMSEAMGELMDQWLEKIGESVAILQSPAALMSGVSGYSITATHVLVNLALCAFTAPPLLVAARVYRRAFEAHTLARGDKNRTRSRVGWPTNSTRSFLVRMKVESFRYKAAWVSYLFIAVILAYLLTSSTPQQAGEEHVPLAVRGTFHLLMSWLGLSFAIAVLGFATIIGEEQAQISLLTTAPYDRGSLVRAKGIAFAFPFVFCIAVALICAPFIDGITLLAAILFVLAAIPLTLFVLGVVLAAGTWPAFLRIHEETPLSHNTRVVVPVLVISALTAIPFLIGLEARSEILAHYFGRGMLETASIPTTVALLLGGLWIVGGITLLVGARIATRNLVVLLGPQDE